MKRYLFLAVMFFWGPAVQAETFNLLDGVVDKYFKGQVYMGLQWGVLKTTAATSGSITLDDSTTIKIEHLAVGQPFPCYVKRVAVSAGSIYILA